MGNYEFDCPSDVAVDSDGNIYVSDFNFGTRVQQYDSSLTYVQTFGVTGVPYLTDENHYNRPSGIAFDDLDNMYISYMKLLIIV